MGQREDKSTIQQLEAAITASVRSGMLVPGQRLIEGEFTRKFGVSRSTVREAFQRLTGDGLLAFEPNRGVMVRQLSRKEVEHVFQVRGALEVLALRLAAPKIMHEPTRIQHLQGELDTAVMNDEMQRFSDLNQLFHGLFVELSGNDILAQMLRRINNTVYWLQFRMLVNRQEVLNSNSQHQDIVQAMVKGDVDLAATIMLGHIDTSHSLIQSLPDDYFTPLKASGG